MRSLFDYPGTYLPQIDRSVSRTARVWCVCGMLWLVAGMAAYLLEGYRLMSPLGLFAGQVWGSAGVLDQVAESILIYGWGVSMCMGVALLLICKDRKLPLNSLSHAGAWLWQGCVLIGVVSLISLSGSGIEGMSFPSWVWPGLILAAAPSFGSIVSSFMNEEQELSDCLVFMSILLGGVILVLGWLLVFVVDIPPYYKGLAALMTRSGWVIAVLFGVGAGSSMKARTTMGRVVVLIGFCLLLGAGTGFELARPGMPWGSGCIPLLVKSVIMISCLFILRRAWDMRGDFSRIMVLLAVVLSGFSWNGDISLLAYAVGVLGMGSLWVLYDNVPRCSGSDWKGRARYGNVLKACLFVFVGGIFLNGELGAMIGDKLGDRVIVRYIGDVVLSGIVLIAFIPLLIQVVLVWSGLGVRNSESLPLISEQKGGAREE